jgi:hypothetical protein
VSVRAHHRAERASEGRSPSSAGDPASPPGAGHTCIHTRSDFAFKHGSQDDWSAGKGACPTNVASLLRYPQQEGVERPHTCRSKEMQNMRTWPCKP